MKGWMEDEERRHEYEYNLTSRVLGASDQTRKIVRRALAYTYPAVCTTTQNTHGDDWMSHAQAALQAEYTLSKTYTLIIARQMTTFANR
jgi:hypothetical protein